MSYHGDRFHVNSVVNFDDG